MQRKKSNESQSGLLPAVSCRRWENGQFSITRSFKNGFEEIEKEEEKERWYGFKGRSFCCFWDFVFSFIRRDLAMFQYLCKESNGEGQEVIKWVFWKSTNRWYLTSKRGKGKIWQLADTHEAHSHEYTHSLMRQAQGFERK